MELLLAAATGITAGLIHVVSGPDHLAAVLPFAVDARKRAVRLGLLWGLGHGVGVVALGLIFLAFRQLEVVHLVSEWSEALVGLLLIGVGAWAFRRSQTVVVHHHPHPHDETGEHHHHHHMHIGDATVHDESHPTQGRHEAHHHSTLGFGFIHGLAGAGHLFAASPLLAFSTAAAFVYLGAYLIGGAAAMSAFSFASSALVSRPQWVPSALRFAGLGSVLIGIAWIAGTV